MHKATTNILQYCMTCLWTAFKDHRHFVKQLSNLLMISYNAVDQSKYITTNSWSLMIYKWSLEHMALCSGFY